VKITIDVDCTPAEAREFFGFPDLRPLQAAWLAEVEKRLVDDMQKFSPEGIARSWLSGTGADWLPNMSVRSTTNCARRKRMRSQVVEPAGLLQTA
jgi:Family of unknown function (DUF6489)